MTIPVGFYESTLIWQQNGKPRPATVALGLDWTGVGSPPSASAAALATYNAANGVSSIATPSFMGVGWSFLGVSTTYQDESGPITAQKLLTSIGTSAVELMPSNCAVLVNKNTALGGRRNRGRCFAPPYYPPEASVDMVGTLVGAAVTNLQGRWDQFFNALSTAFYAPVLFHSSAPFTPSPMSGFSVQTVIATQRRRLRK